MPFPHHLCSCFKSCSDEVGYEGREGEIKLGREEGKEGGREERSCPPGGPGVKNRKRGLIPALLFG